MNEVRPDSAQTCRLLERLGQGDRQALDELLTHYRQELRAFVEARLDPRVTARVDPSDVVQETQMELVRRIDDYLQRRPMPFRLWVRRTAHERLLDVHKYHRGRARRSVTREVPWPERSSLLLARPLLRRSPSPSQRLQAREFAERVSEAVAQLGSADREILLMRHGEDLPFEEIGCILEIEPATARKRFGRALLRLQKVLTDKGLLE
jgi:RNA polymerase sigma-70 factor (ECF subfamily)